MIVERCTIERFENWVRLRQALWPDETLEEHRRYAASIVDRPNDAIVYLAREEDGNVVAFAEATLRRDYVNGCSSSPVEFLEGLYVEIPYRGRGLARLLCKALENWATGLGCTEFASDVLLHNKTGQRVHEALSVEESDRVTSTSNASQGCDGRNSGRPLGAQPGLLSAYATARSIMTSKSSPSLFTTFALASARIRAWSKPSVIWRVSTHSTLV